MTLPASSPRLGWPNANAVGPRIRWMIGAPAVDRAEAVQLSHGQKGRPRAAHG